MLMLILSLGSGRRGDPACWRTLFGKAAPKSTGKLPVLPGTS
jgi:hypothetical protein